LTKEQQDLLKDVHDPVFRESVRDFMVNSQFRRDYWIKGARRISPIEQVEIFKSQKYLMTINRADVPLKVMGALGEAALTENIYNPVLDLMADHKIRTVSQIQEAFKGAEITIAQLIQVVVILSGVNILTLAQDEGAISKTKKSTDKLNKHLMLKARGSNEINHLASPVTGCGQAISRFDQLFTLAIQQGRKKPEELAEFLAEILKFQGEKLVKLGMQVTDELEQQNILIEQANTYLQKQLPILKALQIA
jgi:hypothetical protein